MISVYSLLYKIDLRLNKLATNDHQAIPVENKIVSLNSAQDKLIKLRLDENNIYHQGLDAFKKRYEDLQHLIEPFHLHPLSLELVDPQLNKWSAQLSNLIPLYMFYIDSYVLANKGVCRDHTIYVNRDLTKHADITVLLANNNVNPSFEYQETFCTISSDAYEAYTDGSFNFTNAYISYLRYPVRIDAPGYIHGDGVTSTEVDCELAAYLEDDIVDLAIQDLAMSTENMAASQASQQRTQTNE